ncbi:hypothetical protein HanXRQr2_Chr11g0484301 [Helianthus annuus]|uniref:Uncharacterized protein n=1 Tax=Helianthus annuus TaxID=4232 RepID=A0A9K3N006_HELAN|nr:hypothetical protein HanXRQr2_Chr11g0484301 [Helianthus annuus]
MPRRVAFPMLMPMRRFVRSMFSFSPRMFINVYRHCQLHHVKSDVFGVSF